LCEIGLWELLRDRKLLVWLAPSTSAAAIILAFHLFFVYDIGFGWLRGPLLLVLAGATLLPAWFGEASGSRFLPKRVAASLLLVLMAIPTGYAITLRARRIPLHGKVASQ